jgi:hypothetical protein
MSRLRRLVVSDSWFFITCRVLPSRGVHTASEFAYLSGVIHERREKHGFLLIYLNPVKAGLAKRPEDWPWSSVHDYAGNFTDAPATPSGLSVDRALFPVDTRAFEGVPVE